MIKQIDQQLIEWVEAELKVTPTLEPPRAAEGELLLHLYLLELVDDPLRRNTTRPLHQPALRYLVTAYADDPLEAHNLLSEMLYMAMTHPQYEVELEPLPSHTWSAFAVAPRPSFILRAPLPNEWQPEPAERVRAVGLVSKPVAVFYGLLLGPQETPLAGARVELPNLNRSATTDSKGRFTLNGVPAEGKKTLMFQARGRNLTRSFEETGAPDRPVVIHFDLFQAEGGT